MKKLFSITTLILILISSISFAEEGDTTIVEKEKLKYEFGGFLDVRLMYDSHDNYAARNGAIYFYPTAPVYDAGGQLLNRQDQLRFSPFGTRLSFKLSGFEALGAKSNVYIEGDFMGSSDSYLQLFRIRLAYIDFKWKKNSLLIGQAYNLNFIDDVFSNVVDFAGGLPYNPLNRGTQVRYTQSLAKNITFRAAAEIFDQHKSVGPANSQYNAVWPNFDAQFMFGNPKGTYGGVTFGAKVLKPRKVDDSGYRTDKKISSFSASGFFKFNINDYNFKFWSIYGGNITHLTFIGGYGKVLDDDVNGDYDYANVRTLSSWFDFETPIFSSFQFGLFAAHQQNMGSSKALDLTTAEDGTFKYGYYRDCMLQWHGRISPRILYYATNKLIFGLEYGYNLASWAKSVDPYFNAIELHDLSKDNRMLLTLKYIF